MSETKTEDEDTRTKSCSSWRATRSRFDGAARSRSRSTCSPALGELTSRPRRSTSAPRKPSASVSASRSRPSPRRSFRRLVQRLAQRWRNLSESRSGTRDSNPRHPAWEAGTLPTELVPRAADESPTKKRRPGERFLPAGPVYVGFGLRNGADAPLPVLPTFHSLHGPDACGVLATCYCARMDRRARQRISA